MHEFLFDVQRKTFLYSGLAKEISAHCNSVSYYIF